MASSLPASASSKSLLDALDSPARLQELFASFRAGSSSNTDDQEHAEDRIDGPAGLALLEKRLLLSAQLGLALLEKQEQLVQEKKGLQLKHKELETSVSQLLDRLAQSYKDNAQLIKRAERANANLEASEASNRQLLITLEEDRKAIRRLNVRHQKNAAAANDSSAEPALATELDDLRQELEVERRRANAAEAKARRALSKLADNEQNLEQISQQLEFATEIKKGHERRGSHSISATRNRSRPSSIYQMPTSPLMPAGEPSDSIQIVDLLRHENEAMRHDMHELQALLDSSRDQIAQLRAERSERSAFSTYDDVLSADNSTETPSMNDAFQSPGNSSEPSTSTAPTSNGAHEWMPTPLYQSSSIMGRLPHTSNESTGSSNHTGTRGHARRRSVIRQFPSATGRRAGTRAMSVDLTNLPHRKLEDLESDPYFRSPSPSLRGTSPVLRPFALAASVNSLTSSLGSPALATAHEDIRELEDAISEGPTILEIGPSPIKPLAEGKSVLSMSSPTKRGLRIHQSVSPAPCESSSGRRDIAVQTTDTHMATSPPRVPHRPHFTQYTSSIMSSDLASEFERSESAPQIHTAPDIQRATRTAALSTLMEHVIRLVTKLKGADIVSLEQRLKRQNLPGDVSHLAKTTLRDIVSLLCIQARLMGYTDEVFLSQLQEIDAMRNHFRQVLEHEAAVLAQEGSYNGSDLSNESLMARKDFVTVVKLFRDVLYEMGRLRLIVNRITLEPHLASKLRELEANQTPTDILAGTLPTISDTSGPAALLAPLSRLFYGTEGPQSTPPQAGRGAPNRVKPASRAAASSALAAATVNVEFGGQGGIRRQVSIMPHAGSGGLSDKYNSLGKGSAATSANPARRNLSSIFAGGAGSSLAGQADPWTMLPRNPSHRQGINSAAPNSRQRVYQPYSKNVDAVVDSVAEEDEFRPNLLERTLRPRGLSDSSIHSTFLSHANPSGRLLSPAGLALSATTDAASPREATFTQGDATVKASLANSHSRPSILRAISGTGRAPAKSTTKPHDNPSRVDASPNGYVQATVSDLLSPTKRNDARSKAKAIDGADSESGSSDKGLNIGLGKSPGNGPSGLFANIGAWAARAAGSGISGSYVESGSLMGGGPERRPALRSASTTAVRKPVHREPDL